MNFPSPKQSTSPAVVPSSAFQLTTGTEFRIGLGQAIKGDVRKRFQYVDGKLAKYPGHRLAVSQGILENRPIVGMKGFCEQIANIGHDRALTLGVHSKDVAQRIITKDALKALETSGESTENIISRSKNFINFPKDKPYLLLLDIDHEPGRPKISPEELFERLTKLIPSFARVGRVLKRSSSSQIFVKATGARVSSDGAYHIYILVFGNVETFIENLKAIFWADDQGFHRFGEPNVKTGTRSILERFPIDVSVFDASRWVYEASPILPRELVQRLDPPSFIEGEILHLDSIKATPGQIKQAESNKARSRTAIEALRTGELIKQKKQEFPDLGETAISEMVEQIIRDINNHVLGREHEIILNGGEIVKAGELTEEHLGRSCCDPQEPSYHSFDDNVAMVLRGKGGALIISSHAHGGCEYTIAPKPDQTQGTPDRLSLKDSITSAIDLGLIGSGLEERKIQICSEHRLHALALDVLWRQIEREIERQEGRSDRSDAIDSLLLKKSRRLDISRILPGQLATPLKRRAELLGSTPEVLLTALLPVIASQVKIGTKLNLSRGSEWEALPIFWTGIVGEPATAKSPSLNVFFKPLRGIQGQDIDRYKAEAKRYESDKEKSDDPDSLVEPKKPLRQLVDDITIESLARIQDEQPEHGCLIGVDELAGFVNSFGQYKGGKGGDKQKILSIRDGKGFSVSRSGKDDIMTSASSFSLCGAIQPGVLAQQMGDFTDSDGYWSRFCWCLLPLLRKQLETFEDGPIAQNLRSDLEFIFRSVKELEPIDYELSEAALTLYRGFREEMEDRRMDHPNNTMKIVHGKAQGQVGEIALVLHLMWGVGNDDFTPERTVSAPTFQRAIEVMRFYIVQAELIQALGQEVQGGEDSIYGKILELGREKGWLKASDVNNWIRAIKDDKTKGAEYVRGLFVELEAMGKGELMGEGRSLRFKPFLEGAIVPSTEQPIIQVWTEQDLKDLKDTVTANPDAASSLRECVPEEYWSEIGI